MNKPLITAVLLMAVSLSLLYHFIFIWIYGEHWIQEPNNIVLSYETAGILLIFGYGVRMFVGYLRS